MLDNGTEFPIVVGLDGAIVRSRWLDEALVELARVQPLRASMSLGKSLSGRTAVEEAVARGVTLDIDTWPTSPELLAYLAEQSALGRRIVVVTSAPEIISSALGRKYPFVSEIVRIAEGSSPEAVAGTLVDYLPEGFVYVGTSDADAPIWKAARGGFAVNVREVPSALVGRGGARVLDTAPSILSILRKELRLHQWAKNLLVFVPLVLGGRGGEPEAWFQAFIGMLALSLVASAMYVVNDLLDLPSDRRHWSKKMRPIASGTMSIRLALALAAALTVIGLALAAALGVVPLCVVLLYMVVTLSYSARLKSVPILDVFVLASLFTLRLWLGIVITDVRVSPWLLVFSMFLFLSLSLAKRHTEVLRLHAHGLTEAPGRAYRGGDAPLTLGLGLSATMASVLILIVYLIEDAFPRQQYAEPQFLWAVPPILFMFLGRAWLLCQRGELHDDPVAFAMKDRVSLALGATMVVFALLALVGTGFQ